MDSNDVDWHALYLEEHKRRIDLEQQLQLEKDRVQTLEQKLALCETSVDKLSIVFNHFTCSDFH
jgi:hypothetical protein